MWRSVPQMVEESIRTMASVGCSSCGSGTVSHDRCDGPWYTSAFIAPPFPLVFSLAPGAPCGISARPEPVFGFPAAGSAGARMSRPRAEPKLRRRKGGNAMNEILVATDGSDNADHAVAQAIDLARANQAKLVVAYVRHAPLPLLGEPVYQRSLTRELREADETTAAAAEKAREAGV